MTDPTWPLEHRARLTSLRQRSQALARSLTADLIMLERFLAAHRHDDENLKVRVIEGRVETGAGHDSMVLQALALAGVLPQYHHGATVIFRLGDARTAPGTLRALLRHLTTGSFALRLEQAGGRRANEGTVLSDELVQELTPLLRCHQVTQPAVR